MHERQGNGWYLPRGGKDFSGRQAIALQAFFVSLVTPAQQLVEMHYPGGVRVPEAHGAAEQ